MPGLAERAGRLNGAYAALALPFAAPRLVSIEAGVSVAEIVDAAIAEGLFPAELKPYLVVFLDDEELAFVRWAETVPAPGQHLSLRVRPGTDPVTFLITLAINIAVSAAVGAIIKAFTPDPLPPVGPVYDIAGASNEVAPYRPVPVVLGKMRCFPPHAAKAWTEAVGEKVYLRALLSWGVAPLDLDAASLKLGDTALASFAGVEVQHRLKPSDPWPSLFPSRADEQDGPGLMEFADGWVERTTTATDAQELQVELLFPDGLIFYSGDGSTKRFSVEVRVRYKPVGGASWLSFATGAVAAEGHQYVLQGKWRKPFRETLRRTVAAGQYVVAVKRDRVDDPGPKGRNAFNWSKLRTFTFAPAVTDGNLAVTALRIEAGDQLNGVVDQLNGVVTRRAPLWNAGTESWGAEGPTQNPAALARWIATGPGNPKPRVGGVDLDDAGFGAWAELCTAKGWRCDMELRAGAGLDDVLATVAKCGRAVLVERLGKLTPVIDDVQAAAVQLFTPRNSWGFRVSGRYPEEAHALRLEFSNEEKDYVRDEMVVYFDGYSVANAELIETVQAVGKTRPVEVFRDGRRAIAERILRREEFAWRADVENLACARGQRVAVSHFVMAVGRVSGARVEALSLNGAGTHVTALTLDEVCPQTLGESYGLKWRKVDAAAGAVSVEALAVVNGGAPSATLTLAAPIPLASAPKVGDLVSFGVGGAETL
ncbi:MAG: phage tail protein, partial [Gemmataceae bacterium]|nr:phage tail protein [Gemmataceae bacterium]